MALSTSTDSLAVGASRTFNLSPGSALTLVAPPNVRATVTETPNTVSASGVGGNASRVHNLQLGQTVTYGPYPMGGTVVVANASNSGGAVTWVRSDAIVAESASGSVSLVSGDGTQINLGSLLLSTFPVGIAPSGSVGANGALTLGTALNVIYSGGIFLHFPAGAVFSGSAAGLYYCVMSTTLLGTVYNNVGSGVPSAPASPTAIVDAGPGAYTAPTGVDITLITAPAISAGVFGVAGGFKAEVIGSNNNSASGKTTRLKLNSVNIGGATTSTSTNNSQSITFQNGGAANRNVVFFQNFGASAIGQARSATTVDTSVAMTLVVAAQLATVATDFVIVDTAIVKLLGNA